MTRYLISFFLFVFGIFFMFVASALIFAVPDAVWPQNIFLCLLIFCNYYYGAGMLLSIGRYHG